MAIQARILIVEDEALIAYDISRILTSLHYTVTEVVASGEDAIQQVNEDAPDLVLMDIKLAGDIDGIDTAEYIWSNHHIPILYLTAQSDHHVIERAKATEPYGYITKPFRQEELHTAIEIALYKHGMQRTLQETNERLEREIAERKQAEQEIRKSQEELQLTLEATTDGIWTWTFTTNELFFSPRYYRMLGYESGEFPATFESWNSLIHPDDREHALHTAAEWLKTRSDVYENEFRLRMKNNEYLWIHARGKIVERDENGNALRMIGNHEDITERKQAEHELKKNQEQLRNLSARLAEVEEAEKQRLSRELHDRVGQNLTALNINLNILRSQLPAELAEKLDERLNDTHKLVEETTEVIRNVMAELRPLVLDDYGLPAALRWYGELFAKRTEISVKIKGEEFPQRPSPSVEIALFRISQEALTNVAKHAGATQVTISLDMVSGSIVLSLHDDGSGFDPLTLRTSGLGLVAMRERAISIGGNVKIESSPGNGTTIQIEILLTPDRG